MTTESDGLVDALAQISFVTMAVLSKAAAGNDLSLTQLRVLGILRDRRVWMAALADFLGLEKSTLSGLVDRAEKRGLLERAPSAGDGRAVDVFITPAGAEHAGRVHESLRQALSPLTTQLAPAEQRRLQSLLEKILSPNGPS